MNALTNEQVSVVNSSEHRLVVNAFAGTGKTSTLVEFAKARGNKKILYLAFNKSIREEATHRFGSYANCKTTHGLAYSDFGAIYQGKLGNLRVNDVKNLFGVSYEQAIQAISVVEQYLTSVYPSLDDEFIKLKLPGIGPYGVPRMVATCQAIWKAMQAAQGDATKFKLPMTHNGYLKLYHLSGKPIDADIVLFDEAQDANPLVIDLVLRHQGQSVIMGDSYQAIYGFNYAKDALTSFDAQKTLFLTHSFRFGQGIADVATALLREWRGCTQEIVGHGPESVFHVNKELPYASLHRTNSTLFDSCVSLVNSKKEFGLIGGIAGYKFDKILSAYYLSRNMKTHVTDANLKGFPSFAEFETYAETTKSLEDLFLIRVVREHGHQIPKLIDQIKSKAKEITTDTMNITMPVLTTVHKSKGLEFKQVVMAPDYCELSTKLNPRTGNIDKPDDEEVHLSYVGLTRATKNISVSRQMGDWLMQTKQYPDRKSAKPVKQKPVDQFDDCPF